MLRRLCGAGALLLALGLGVLPAAGEDKKAKARSGPRCSTART